MRIENRANPWPVSISCGFHRRSIARGAATVRGYAKDGSQPIEKMSGFTSQ